MDSAHFTGHGMLDCRCNRSKQLLAEMEADGSFESEDFGYAQELVTQYGGDYVDDAAEIFQISAKDMFVIMKMLGYRSSNSESKERVEPPRRPCSRPNVACSAPDCGSECRHRSPATAEVQGKWQYYYRSIECTAADSSDPNCVCWHDEGRGPYNNASHDDEDTFLTWRYVANSYQSDPPRHGMSVRRG